MSNGFFNFSDGATDEPQTSEPDKQGEEFEFGETADDGGNHQDDVNPSEHDRDGVADILHDRSEPPEHSDGRPATAVASDEALPGGNDDASNIHTSSSGGLGVFANFSDFTLSTDDASGIEGEGRGDETQDMGSNGAVEPSDGNRVKGTVIDRQTAMQMVADNVREAGKKAAKLPRHETIVEEVYSKIYDTENSDDLPEGDKKLAEIQTELIQGVFQFALDTLRAAETLRLLFGECLSHGTVDEITEEFAKHFIKQMTQAKRLASATQRRIAFLIPSRMPTTEALDAIPDDDYNCWKAKPVVELESVTPHVEDVLHKAEIYRCGQLHHLIMHIDMNPAKFTWPKGVGKVKAEAIKRELKNLISDYEQLPEGGRQTESDTDALKRVIKKLRDTGHLQYSQNLPTWIAGSESYESGRDILECPWRPGQNQSDWVRGFLFAEAHDAKKVSYQGTVTKPTQE